jgi:hypothetical protein
LSDILEGKADFIAENGGGRGVRLRKDALPKPARQTIRSSSSKSSMTRRALESAGVEFVAENGGGAGVRLRKTSSQLEHRE